MRRASRGICMPNIAAMWVDRRRLRAQVARAVAVSSEFPRDSDQFVPDSAQAWVRLGLALAIASVGAVGMWSVMVVMPIIQAEFAATRGAVSLAATMIFFGFGLGGVIIGKVTDRLGIVTAIAISIVAELLHDLDQAHLDLGHVRFPTPQKRAPRDAAGAPGPSHPCSR